MGMADQTSRTQRHPVLRVRLRPCYRIPIREHESEDEMSRNKQQSVRILVVDDNDVPLIADLQPLTDSGRRKRRITANRLNSDLHDDGRSSTGSQDASQEQRLIDCKDDDDEAGDEESGSEHEAMDYFVGISNRTNAAESRVLEWDANIDETVINYLESDAAVSDVRSRNRKLFPHIFLMLHEKFNVIMYGFGSKRNLLNTFSTTYLSDEHYLMINGYFPALTAKDVANNLKDALQADSSDINSILHAVDELDDTLYLVIHSIDVLFSANSPKIKQLIMEIVIRSQGTIRLIATVDHVNSGLLFNSTEKTKMDLMWVHIPTFSPYTIERGYTGSADAASGDSDLTLASVIHVYDSLTPNAQKIFLQILDYYVDKKKRSLEEKQQKKEEAQLARQLINDKKRQRKRKSKRRQQQPEDNDEEEPEHELSDDHEEQDDEHRIEFGTKGKSREKQSDASDNLPFSVLYRICREQYLVNSEITLKAQLIEFQDHNFMRVRKSSDGTPVVRLLISLDLAQTFLNKIRDV
jgi:hypothetical protein